MSASDHLNEVQFMPTHEMAKHWDPALKDPETFRGYEASSNFPGHLTYQEKLTQDIKEHGIHNPVQLSKFATAPSFRQHHDPNQTYIYDGHHRVLAAMDLGLKEVPYKWVSGKPGEQ